MKCLIVQPIHGDGLDLLRTNGVTPVPCPAATDDHILPLIDDCDAVITRDAGLSGRAIMAGRKLRVIVIHGAGHDPVDMETATRKGVLVCNTPGANARSVSELALGLAIAAARAIPAADAAQRRAEASFRERVATTELSGKVALIVGWGSIGSGLGQMLRDAFGMTVLVHSPRARDVQGFETVADLHAGLARADLISLHTPLRDQTRGLIGTAAFAACKRGAILVNTARAGLVDEVALAAALSSGQIASAGLDVYSPTAPQGSLGRFPQVIFTPHLGGSTQEALARVATASARNTLAALHGIRPETALNAPEAWS
ncbi:NAD(P)-dependent oxidoreductase [Cereibacter sp. SYSU M97828]|nr:NAD(P)-dependent oxidoreductase [Cereibacter flavus]